MTIKATSILGQASFNLLVYAAGTYDLTATSATVTAASELTPTTFTVATSNTFIVTQATRVV